MRSAFGVFHKSFVPGVGYKAAKDLSTTERHIVRNKAIGNIAAFKTKGSPARRAPSKPRTIHEGFPTERGKLNRVLASRSQTNLGLAVKGASLPDGRGGGHVILHNDAFLDTPESIANTERHEMAHIAPRRNPSSTMKRLRDPVRLGREEGRADFLASGKQTTGQYPGSDEFQRGYNEVQGRMAAAKWRTQNLRKSAFGVIDGF